MKEIKAYVIIQFSDGVAHDYGSTIIPRIGETVTFSGKTGKVYDIRHIANGVFRETKILVK